MSACVVFSCSSLSRGWSGLESPHYFLFFFPGLELLFLKPKRWEEGAPKKDLVSSLFLFLSLLSVWIPSILFFFLWKDSCCCLIAFLLFLSSFFFSFPGDLLKTTRLLEFLFSWFWFSSFFLAIFLSGIFS